MTEQKTRIKICGLRRMEDIEAVNRYQPDYAGFICSSRFWRFISKDTLTGLRHSLKDNIRSVGVFVDEPVDYIADYVRHDLIDMVQLHGHEPQSYIQELQKEIRVPVIKAFKIESEEDIEAARQSIADYVLLDNGAWTGQTFDWSLIRDIGRPFFLAGGLNENNAVSAVEKFQPYAVDISGGVETDRRKDPEKIRRVIRLIRSCQ